MAIAPEPRSKEVEALDGDTVEVVANPQADGTVANLIIWTNGGEGCEVRMNAEQVRDLVLALGDYVPE